MPKKITPQGGQDIPYPTEEPSLVKSENPAILEANKMGQELEYIPLNTIGKVPEVNAMDRSQTIPDTEEYNKGGKVPEGAMDLITKKRGGMLQSKKQKEEQKERRKKARERNLKIQRNGKKKWSGQA